jgi:uncharacterized membrane-anchored protein
LSGGSGSSPNGSRQEKSSRLTPASIVYWSRLGFAVLAAAVYNALGLGLQGIELGTLGAVGLGIAFYILSIYFYRYVLGYGEAELKGPRKIITTGMGTYIIWLLFAIILLNTILFGR